MSAFDKNAEHLKGELRNLKNRFFEIRGDQKCEDCSRGIFTEEFYVFPCGHCYHKVLSILLRTKSQSLIGMFKEKDEGDKCLS